MLKDCLDLLKLEHVRSNSIELVDGIGDPLGPTFAGRIKRLITKLTASYKEASFADEAKVLPYCLPSLMRTL